jgi:cytoskeleton protein RodZ
MSIGTQLRQARDAQSLSLDQAAQATHIKVYYLQALEDDRYDALPSAAQLRGFLRAYGEYLKLNSSDLIADLEQGAPHGHPSATPVMAVDVLGPVSVSSDAIFKELGNTLKSQRELMGLSLGDVERHTHIRIHYIKALEEGDISHLPSPVQGRGMLSNYASFLGLNTESVLLRFADGLQASLADRQAARNVQASRSRPQEAGQLSARPSRLKRFFSMDLFVGGFLVLFLLGFTIWGAMRVSKLNNRQTASPTAPPVSEILLASPTTGIPANATLLPTEEITAIPTNFTETGVISGTLEEQALPSPIAAEPTAGLQTAALQVYVVVLQRAWLRMTVDGVVAFEGRVIPGSAYTFSGNERIELLTGDGAGLQVYFNQQDLGVLGGFGEVVNRIFSLQGVQTATPAVPPTSTPIPTSPATASPTPTGTEVPSTPTPTPRS